MKTKLLNFMKRVQSKLMPVSGGTVYLIGALNTAATGLSAQQANLEQISNDIANSNTDGYKRSRNEFQDLMYQTIREPGAQTGNGSQTPVGVQVGMGVRVGAAHRIFEQGTARMTYNNYDMMIEGAGFFPVLRPNGEVGYTRVGAFHRDAQGRIILANGCYLIPQMAVPPTALSISVTPRGEVKAAMQSGEEIVLGQIQLVTFQNPEGLMGTGDGLYRTSLASGQPLQGIPGENGLGLIQHQALESSNVNVATSMVEMISTQRAYEMNTKVMGVADQMLGATANIK